MATPLSPVKTSVSSGAQRLPKLDWDGRLNVTSNYKLKQMSQIEPRTYALLAQTNNLTYDRGLRWNYGNWVLRSLTGYSHAAQAGILKLIDYDGTFLSGDTPTVYHIIAQWPLAAGATFSFDSPVYSHSGIAISALQIALGNSDDNAQSFGLLFESPDNGGVSFTALLEAAVMEP